MGVALAPHKNQLIEQQQQDRGGGRLACGRIASPSSKENSRPNHEPLDQQRQQQQQQHPLASAAMPVAAIVNHKKKKKKKKLQQQRQHASPPPPESSSSPWNNEVEFVSLLHVQELQPTVEALRFACAASQHKKELAEIDKVLGAVTPRLSCWSTTSCSRAPPPCVCRLKNPAFLRKAVLKSVWDWFEEPSICGVQVKSCGEGDERFDAYLVPYISAIRLFGNRSDDTVPLLFEFYETEQLTLRLPLHHRIQELLKDNPSACTISGDATLLERCSIRSLHPSSWFAVAWYPIYKVPEGQFRCVFLTYYSLGHVQANGSLPVLGLQTYHCQVDQWFSLKQGIGESDSRETLKQRFSSLDRSALVMSRGSDRQSQTFQHADYEFFTSRKY